MSNDYLRFALILSDSHAKTLKTNLEKLIINVLVESYGKGLTANGIADKIRSFFSLEFTIEEIFAIAEKSESIIVQNDTRDSILTLFDLTPEAYKKTYKKTEESLIDNVVKDFCNQNKDFASDEVHNCLIRFFYISFESNKQTLLSLIRQTSINEGILETSFSEKEKNIINLFLDWDNKNKDRLVWYIVSASYDYCLMTIKKDNSYYGNIFNGKTFYLDTNIILGLAGINKEERRNNYRSFIEKCREQKIQICYTNITKAEINRTLDNYINAIEALNRNIGGISSDAINDFIKQDARQDFYSAYVKWVKKDVNNAGNFSGFRKYLMKEIEKVLSEFKAITIDTTYISSNQHFDNYCDEFRAFKENRRHRSVSRETARTDIQNYLFLRKQNAKIGAQSFLEIKNYLITADKSLVLWVEQNIPGSIPTVVFPSVWYSIILKFCGRSDDDFKSYSQFIKFYLYDENQEINEIKEKILISVAQLEESPSIKNEIIEDINYRLTSGEYILEGSTDISAIIENSHEYVTQKKIDETKDTLVSEYEEKVRHESESAFLRGKAIANEEWMTKEAVKKEKREKRAQELIGKRIQRNKFLFSALLILFGMIFVAGVVCLCLKFEYNIIIGASSLAFAITFSILSSISKKYNWFSTDEKIVAKKIEKKLDRVSKKLSKIIGAEDE